MLPVKRNKKQVNINDVIYSLISTNGHLSKMATSLQRPLVLPQWTNNPFIDSCVNLFTMATFFYPQGSYCGKVQLC